MKQFGTANQPNASYIPARATSPQVGPGTHSPSKEERPNRGALSFSKVPRFGSPKTVPSRAASPVFVPWTPAEGPQLHFSRRTIRTNTPPRADRASRAASPVPPRQGAVNSASPARRRPPANTPVNTPVKGK